ncbi:exocyst complex component Sec5 [Trichodelitschia bisporula]|uniref:Exocyst complex component SEC5 n=1 Tax=Trichodelitschia bisporula TaxID=703511 RepID=A0A6G1I0B2_9PEZI|nr:exocyst complex component Sec5 [Trichodelitschia bisporula]
MIESTLLNHYKIDTLFPAEWPAGKDHDDSSEDEQEPARITKRKSRFSVLDRNASYRSSIPGAERTKDGVENLVQKDEPDPLGGPQSVIQILRQRGLPIEEDSKLRNRFLLSSTTFSPSLFLAQVHNGDSTDSLLAGLDFLSRSIEKKSASLKVLVESNFERFVRAKATIDNVYNEMRNQGLESDAQPGQRRSQGRHQSKNSGQFKRMSMALPSLGDKPLPNDKRKNALIKEMEYGVLPIKVPLTEVAVKAEEVWGPALGGREKEDSLKAVISCMEKHRSLFELGSSISECIKRRDNEALVEEYIRTRKAADDARSIVETSVENRIPLTDQEVNQVIVTARMWADVEKQVSDFKREVWRKLAGTHFSKHPASETNKSEEHMELISVLLELGVEDNPIWVWLLSRYDFLKSKITTTFERSRVEIEILRRRLANSGKPTGRQLATYLRAATPDGSSNSRFDSPQVIETWDHIYTCLTTLLSTQGGVLGEVIEFWETVQSFIEGRAQKTLPIGIDGASRKHHRLSMDGVKDLSNGAQELIKIIREELVSFFSDPPVEDISLLFSPIPPTPDTPRTPHTPKSATLSPFVDSRFKFDPANVPPPSPRTGESWEKFAFWPPYADSLSGAHYLAKILLLVGNAASEMANISFMKDGARSIDTLKFMVGTVRERCVSAACAAWNHDAENCKVLEDWTQAPDRHDLTNMPKRFLHVESFLLVNLQKLLYLSEATKRPDAPEVVVPPSGKVLQSVRNQFAASIYKALSGMVEIAEQEKMMDDSWDGEDGLAVPVDAEENADGKRGTWDAQDRNIRILLTLSNIQSLRNDVVPHLVGQFETFFSVKLTDETATIRDVLSQIDSRLFTSYVQPISSRLDKIIRDGINAPSWEPDNTRPTDARPYVYKVLLSLVLTHSEVSTTAAPLTAPILKHLLEALSGTLMVCFKTKPRFTLSALVQATLDVEFIAQTMNNYTTERAGEIQNAIYVSLDQRTDNEARLRLQDELQEMRSTLRRLRESTKVEFVCFKRTRMNTRAGEGGRPDSRPSIASRPGSRPR